MCQFDVEKEEEAEDPVPNTTPLDERFDDRVPSASLAVSFNIERIARCTYNSASKGDTQPSCATIVRMQ